MGWYMSPVDNSKVKGDKYMIKIWGSAEVPRFDLSDFDTEKYKYIAYCVNKEGGIVGAFMSESSDPPHFCVVDGAKELFYKCRVDALAYLESTESKKSNGRRR